MKKEDKKRSHSLSKKRTKRGISTSNLSWYFMSSVRLLHFRMVLEFVLFLCFITVHQNSASKFSNFKLPIPFIIRFRICKKQERDEKPIKHECSSWTILLVLIFICHLYSSYIISNRMLNNGSLNSFSTFSDYISIFIIECYFFYVRLFICVILSIHFYNVCRKRLNVAEGEKVI